jgi:lipopolysaccharide transport system permease protein
MSNALSAKPLFVIRARRGWGALHLAELWRFRDLLLALSGRDLKLRYKQTVLGVVWVILQPLISAGILSFVFGSVAKLNTPVPYFLLSFAGLLGWNLFSGSVTRASVSMTGNSALVSKVYFPRMLLPLSATSSAFVDFAVAGAMMAVLMLVHGVRPGPEILLLPVWIVLLLMLAIGIGLFAAGLTVSYRDVGYVLPVVVQSLLYASPVAYTLDQVPAKFRLLYLVNPIAPLLEGFRWSLLGSVHGAAGGVLAAPPLWSVAYGATTSVVFFVMGVALFGRMERRFADVI